MRFAVAVVLSALAVSCTHSFHCDPTHVTVATLPALGDTLPDPGPTCMNALVSPSQTWPSYETSVGGVAYTIGVDGQDHVRYVGTDDAGFVSPEQLKVGASLDDVLRAANGESVVNEPGWGKFVPLPSGWRAFVDERNRVVFFFLRD